MKTRGYLIIMALTALSLSGCRKPLCYDHDLHGLGSRHEVQAEWEKEWERDFGKKWEERWRGVLGFGYDALRPEAAEGIRARVFTDGKPENEANLREGKLAIGTPIAKALLGKKVGDVVEVTVPAGVIKFEIKDISI